MSNIDDVDLPVLMSMVKDKLENSNRTWFLEVKLNAREWEKLINCYYEKQNALEELVKQVKDLEIIKKLLTNDIDCVGNLNIVKNRNKLWFLTGEINIVGNQIEKVNNQIKNLENKKEEVCEKQ